MNKMAMYVEGRTELEFNIKLITAIAGTQPVSLERRAIKGGTRIKRYSERMATMQLGSSSSPCSHFISLRNCSNDTLIKDRMLEDYKRLVQEGFKTVICQRDILPDFSFAQISELERGLKVKVPTKDMSIVFILSVMEIEAWFLAEHTHFSRIDPRITLDSIRTTLGFDPSSDDMQLQESPAQDLHNCYAIGKKAYSKQTSQGTINALDIDLIYLEVADRFPYLRKLCDEIGSFLALPYLSAIPG